MEWHGTRSVSYQAANGSIAHAVHCWPVCCCRPLTVCCAHICLAQVSKKIAGQGIANPTALLLATSMMLRHLQLHSFSDRCGRRWRLLTQTLHFVYILRVSW